MRVRAEPAMSDITELIAQVASGDAGARERLFAAAYPELQRKDLSSPCSPAQRHNLHAGVEK
jgi:hypothetical protein